MAEASACALRLLGLLCSGLKGFEGFWGLVRGFGGLGLAVGVLDAFGLKGFWGVYSTRKGFRGFGLWGLGSKKGRLGGFKSKA